MTCCIKGNKEDEDAYSTKAHESFVWQPTVQNAKKIAYVRHLEKQYECLQASYLNVRTELARLQACLKQLVGAAPKDRNRMIDELGRKVLREIHPTGQCYNEFPTLEEQNVRMGDIKRKQCMLIQSLRQRIGTFEKASQSLLNEKENELRISLSKTTIKADSPSKSSIKRENVKKKWRQAGGAVLRQANRATVSRETCNSVSESLISTRSTSFKELQEMYQRVLSLRT